MRISDWSSDVCSSDLRGGACPARRRGRREGGRGKHRPYEKPWRSSDGASRRIPLHELARDDDTLQFVGALADAEQRRVAIVALDVEFLGVTIEIGRAHV